MPARFRISLFVTLATLALAAPASADVFAPDSTPFGKTYGEWNAQWWTTMGQTPAGKGHPFATGEVKCSGVNDGRVVFLAGTTGGSATRSCKVPSSKALLLPLLNFVCFSDGDDTEPELRDCAAGPIPFVTNLEAKVDGTDVPDLFSFRAPSPLFTFTAIAGNTLGFDPVSQPAVADGYYVMLKPLSRGTHTLVFGGDTSFGFSAHATYTLTVVK